MWLNTSDLYLYVGEFRSNLHLASTLLSLVKLVATTSPTLCLKICIAALVFLDHQLLECRKWQTLRLEFVSFCIHLLLFLDISHFTVSETSFLFLVANTSFLFFLYSFYATLS